MARKNRPAGIPVPLSKIEQHLLEQLSFLRKSARDYDQGDSTEFRRLAVTLRILLHHRPPGAHSVIEQANLGGAEFASTAMPINPRNLVSEFSLAMIHMTQSGSRLVPALGSGPFLPRWATFENWWAEPVLRDDHKHLFTRADIVRSVADQDGGAHVDPELNEAYHRLANEHSIGVIASGPDGERPLEHIEKAYIRQIAWETELSISKAWAKVVGNRPCECGSGRKHRYCHGKIDVVTARD